MRKTKRVCIHRYLIYLTNLLIRFEIIKVKSWNIVSFWVECLREARHRIRNCHSTDLSYLKCSSCKRAFFFLDWSQLIIRLIQSNFLEEIVPQYFYQIIHCLFQFKNQFNNLLSCNQVLKLHNNQFLLKEVQEFNHK